MKLRAIKYARNVFSRSIIYDSSIIFNNGEKESFLFQRKVLTDEIFLECICCERALTVSFMPNELGYKTFYFKHKNTYEECEFLALKNNLEKEELEHVYYIPESPRHKHIKNFLRENFLKNPEIEILSFDDKYILDCYKKRKPDIFIFYKGKEIVFEVQVSNLSLKYINARTKFYNEKKIYVIWVLDGFSQSDNFLRNIKYNNKNQNIFSFSEDESKLFNCKYKEPYIYDKQSIREKYKNDLISIEDLKFSDDSEVFYFPYLFEYEEKEKELLGIVEKERRINNIKKNRERINNVNGILIKLKAYKEKGETLKKFEDIIFEINGLDYLSVKFLNKKLSKKEHYFFKFFKKAENKHFGLLLFLLKCSQLNYEISEKFDSKTIIEIIVGNKNLDFHLVYNLFCEIINRGYILKSNDINILRVFSEESKFFDLREFHKLLIFNDLKSKNLKDEISKYYPVIMLIKSIIAGKIMGYHFKENEWIQFFNLVYKARKNCFGYVVDVIKKENKIDYFVNLKKSKALKEKIKESENCNLKSDENFKIIFEDLFEDYLWI